MANTSSAKKAVRKIARRTDVNRARRSLVRSKIRKFDDAIAAGDKAAATEAFKAVEPAMMRAVSRGVLHQNTAARKISRLSKQVKSLAESLISPDKTRAASVGGFVVGYLTITAKNLPFYGVFLWLIFQNFSRRKKIHIFFRLKYCDSCVFLSQA